MSRQYGCTESTESWVTNLKFSFTSSFFPSIWWTVHSWQEVSWWTFVPKKLNSEYFKISPCTKKLWHGQVWMHAHKHWTAILTTKWSSAKMGLTKNLQPLSIILQSINKMQCEQPNFDIYIWHLTFCDLDLQLAEDKSTHNGQHLLY
jgi:hypothetical protein